MLDWLSNGFSTYILHVQHGDGYQWWSGFGGRSFGIATALGIYWHHVNCHEPGCFRVVRRHQTHCRKHAARTGQ